MLTIDFLEFLDCLLGILLRVEKIETLVVEPVGGLIGGRVILLGEHIEAAAGAKDARQKSDRANTGNRHPSATLRRLGRAFGNYSGHESLEHERIHAKLLPRKGGFAKDLCAARRSAAGLSENNQFSHATKPTFGPD
jgi:hypothetical protein